MTERRRQWLLRGAGALAVLFGALTVVSGGRALFGGPAATAAVGNAVPFVLWFNFVAGFAYVVAGAGLALSRRWAVGLAVVIAGATAAVFVVFGIHVALGGAYEIRTVAAMTLRSGFWAGIAILAVRSLGWPGGRRAAAA